MKKHRQDIKRKKREHRKKRQELEVELGDLIDNMDPEDHVAVVNTETGEMLTGNDAPTASRVEEWLLQNLKYGSLRFIMGHRCIIFIKECVLYVILIEHLSAFLNFKATCTHCD